jgi:hypothetical protein
MPNPNKRRTNQTAKDRVQEKYIDIPHKKHPHRLWPAIVKATEFFRNFMKTRNYIKVITQIQDNLYILAQYYIFCDEDIWACGDGIVFNSNPDKKILVQPLCILTRRECPCYHESSAEFFTMCPSCMNIQVAVKGTRWICEECGAQLKYNEIDNAPYMKIDCSICPVETGWEKVKEMHKSRPEFYKKYLKVRKHVAEILAHKNLKQIQEEFDKEAESES